MMRRMTKGMVTGVTFLVLAAVAPPAAADLIPTTISTNMTLTRDGNPWMLHGNTLVKNGAVLEIDAGVVVEAVGNFLLEADGATDGLIVVQGAPYDSVYFRAQVGGTAHSLWQGIKVGDGIGSSFDHAVVMNAKKGLNLIAASPPITHCAFRHCETGIWCLRSSPAVTSCWISETSFFGIMCETPSGGGAISNPIIFDCNLFDNSLYSVYLLGYGGGTPSTEINASGNWWGTTAEPEIEASIFDQNDDGGVNATVKYEPFRPNVPVEHRTWGSIKALFRD